MNNLKEDLKYFALLLAVHLSGIGAMAFAGATGFFPIGVVGFFVAFVSGALLLPILICVVLAILAASLIVFLLWSIAKSVFDQVIAPRGGELATLVVIGLGIGLVAYLVQVGVDGWRDHQRRRTEQRRANPPVDQVRVVTTPVPLLTYQPAVEAPRARLCRGCGGRIEANQERCANPECAEDEA